MAKQISITLDDEQQAVVEEIVRLQEKALKGSPVASAARVVQCAVATGLRRDLGTLRRMVHLAERLRS